MSDAQLDDDYRDLTAFLKPGYFLDSDTASIRNFTEQHIGETKSVIDKAVRLYYAVRDKIVYDPYVAWAEEKSYIASECLAAGRGFCVSKASLLAACGRAAGIPSRIAFADVRNHLCTPRLRALMGTDVFTYHGITEFYLNDRWIKATPTFNLSLCERFGVVPLEFDGREDALLHAFDRAGRRHMEYLRYHGAFDDVPADLVRKAMISAYGRDAGRTAIGGDFAAEARGDG